MKKLKDVDAFGYTPKEFDGWLKGTVKRMLKHAQKRESDKEIQTVFPAPPELM
jgi:hypothetical protein